MWGKNIRVVIIPSFLAIAYLGQSSCLHLISRFFNLSPLAIWLVTIDATSIVQNQNLIASWGNTTFITALSASMAVNSLVTGLIAARVLKVFLEVKGTMTLIERSTGGANLKLRHVLFVIIESAMALFAIQLIRLVVSILPNESYDILGYVIVIHQMFNVIIRSIHVYFFCFTDNIYQGIAPTIILVRVSMRSSFDDEESFKEAAGSLCSNNPSSDLTY